MAENNANPFADTTRQFTEGQNQFLKMWTDFAGKMANAGVAFSPESTPPDSARQMRSAFFKAWTDYCEEYMRSPEFLESWKKAMGSAIQFRRQMNQSLGQLQHEFQGTSRQDIDQLMMAMTHLERRLVDNVERAADRVDELGARIEALEEKIAGLEHNGGAAKTAAPKKKKEVTS